MEKINLTKEYLVAVDYYDIINAMSFDEEVVKAIKKFIRSSPPVIKSSDKFTVKLFSKHDLKEDGDPIAALSAAGFRPAKLRETLAFVYKYPEFKKISIISFESANSLIRKHYYRPICEEKTASSEYSLDYRCFCHPPAG